jgi:hypothetical protein
VVTRRRETATRVPEHLAQRGATAHRRREGWAIVDHAIHGEQLSDLVVEPVIDTVRVTVNEVDNLVLVHQPPKRTVLVTGHQALRKPNKFCIHLVPDFAGVLMTMSSGRNRKRLQRKLSKPKL